MPPGVRSGLMTLFDARIASILTIGLLSSSVLLSSSTPAPTVTVSQLWGLGEDADLTVVGLLVSLHSYDSGSEALTLADVSGSATAKAISTFSPGPPPSEYVSIGDMLAVTGQCTFREGEPCVYCRYTDVKVLSSSEEVLTVDVLSRSWSLFEGDDISVLGIVEIDAGGVIWLRAHEGEAAIRMAMDRPPSFTGPGVVHAKLVMDAATMSLVLKVYHLSAAD